MPFTTIFEATAAAAAKNSKGKSIAPLRPSTHTTTTTTTKATPMMGPLRVNTAPVPAGASLSLSMRTSAAETENIRPPSSVKTEASDTDKGDREPLSPLPAEAPLVAQIPLSLKDARAYEHERQRVKRAAERAARHRAKKAGVLHHQAHTQAERRTRTWRGVGPVDLVEVDAGLLPIDKGSSPVCATVLIEGHSTSFSAPTLSPTPKWTESNRPIELDLASLLTNAKSGAGRKVRGERDGFEFVPPVRSVIALDDESFSNSGEVEEGWEHIEREDGRKRGAASYAQVAALRTGE